MHSYSSNVTNARAASVPYHHKSVIGDAFPAATIVNEICSTIGILFFAAGIYRIIDISKPLGWSLALVTILILVEIVVTRLRLAFCGSLISLLLAATVFGAILDATGSLPDAALATVAASLIYLARLKTPLVLTAISVALTGVYIAINDATLDLALIALVAACLLMVVETAQSYRRISEPLTLTRKIRRTGARSMRASETRLVASSSRRIASVYR